MHYSFRHSIGSRLFLYVLGGSLIGLSGISFFFYQALENSAKEEIQGRLGTQIKLIEGQLNQADQAMLSVVAGVKTLDRMGIKTQDSYKQMLLELFQNRSDLMLSLNFGQTPYGILADRRTFWPYFFLDQDTPQQIGSKLLPPYEELRFADVCKVDPKCIEQDYYKLPIAAQKAIWLEPYQWSGITMTTTTAPIFDEKKKLIGVAGLDINVTALSQKLQAPKNWKGGYYAILSEKGNVLAYPPDLQKAKDLATYKNVEDLKDIWQKVSNKPSGIFIMEGNYWAYQKVQNTRWIMLACVPQSVVLVPALSITLSGALGAGAVLALVVFLFVRRLNYRLRPIVDECRKLMEANIQRSQRFNNETDLNSNSLINTGINITKLDELDVLEYSFHQMTSQLNTSFEELEIRVEDRTLELKAAKELADSANYAKSEFLANMSHELRTPLNGILGYAQILKQSDQLAEQEQKGINIIHQCGSHLLTLINDILDLSKIEAQKMDLHFTEFHFPSFLESVTEICRIKAEQKGIDFIYQPDGLLPIGIKSDEKRLRQVLINLLSNAIKFTDKGSVTFLIKNQKLEVNNTIKGVVHHICFQVEDTGVGIKNGNLDKIFLPFEQVGAVQKQAEGTGLGLAISKKIATMMGGSLNVKSQIGKGSIFWLEVDVEESIEWAISPNELSRRRIVGFQEPRQKILVIDDRWENRSVISKLLEPIGFEMNEAQDGQEGLDKVNELKPDLIICDLAMPVMDGHEMIKKLRQDALFKKIPIIVSSASVFETDRQKSIDAGANEFLPKPIQSDILLNLIQQLLNLKWIYEVSKESAQAYEVDPIKMKCSALILPSIEDLHLLYDLSRKGLVHNLNQEMERIEKSNSQTRPFIQEIRQLVKSYQLTKIRGFIEPYLT
jgi:signal transduction histidine kinase/ActR/RegA family two-component response regulator